MVERQGTGLATAGLVCGIVGLVFSFIITPIGFLTGIAGIICSALGMKSGMTRAKVGLGLSIGAVSVSVLWWLFVIAMFF